MSKASPKIDFRLPQEARDALERLAAEKPIKGDKTTPADHLREALRKYLQDNGISVSVDVPGRGKKPA